jgi:toxin YhaV
VTIPFTTVNGWRLYKHPAFGTVLKTLTSEVLAIPEETRSSHPKAKLLKRIFEVITKEIPENPGADKYLQGNTVGPSYRHWYRAKFLQRYRLFFRFNSKEKVIIYAWLNDESTLRKSGAKTDPYTVFRKRLTQGNPPDDWDSLLEECER